MSDTVLVTGAGGFVGSAVTRALVRGPARFADGAPVGRVVALLSPWGSPERLAELAPSDLWTIERADVTDSKALQAVLTQVRPRAVLHLAVQRATFRQPPAGDGDALTIGPLEVLLAGLSEIPGGRLVHTSTSWVLEPGVSLDEGAELRPQSAYAEHKALADRRLPGLAQPAGVEWIDLRLFNVFGRYEQASRLLPYLVARLSAGEEARVSRGDQLRDFNDVDHVAEAYLRALAAPPAAAGRVYHIGSGRGTTARELAMAVAEETGRADLIRFGARDTPDAHVACLVANPARARELLGWEPHTDLEARIARAVRWWQERSQRGR